MSEVNASNDSHEAWNKVVEWLSKHSSLAGIEPGTDLNGFLATELNPALLIEKPTKNSTKLVHFRVPVPNGENRIYPYDKIAKQKHRCSFESIP